MNAPVASAMLKQHLIDPEICIRCNTCEDTCPIKAISHDSRNYVVDASICKACLACIAPCPTGAIDNWRMLPSERAYSLSEQLGWDELPAEDASGSTQPGVAATALQEPLVVVAAAQPLATAAAAAPLSASVPPW